MKWVCGVLVLVVVAVAASAVMVQRSLSGQNRSRPLFRVHPATLATEPTPAPRSDQRADDPVPVPAISVGDALLRPLDLPFGEPTTLADVQKYLAGALGAPVVLDLAALDRLGLDPEDRVQLDLKGVRLKTGLKLLLDQLGMTWRVVAEDNLLILTDPTETADPIDRALRQLKVIHDEMHDLRDAVDDLRSLVEEELGVDPETDPNKAIFVRAPARPTRPRPRPAPAPTPRSTRSETRG